MVDCWCGSRLSEIITPCSLESAGSIRSTYTTSPEKLRLKLFSFSPAIGRVRVSWYNLSRKFALAHGRTLNAKQPDSPQAMIATPSTGIAMRCSPMPQALAAVSSWSLDIRPKPSNTPSSTAIGKLSSRNAGMM